MKKIKITSGIKRIEDLDINAALFRFRDVLNEHRSVLISRIVSDLSTYIDYKFQLKAGSKELELIKDNLYALKNSVIDLERYSDITDHFKDHEMTYVGIEPFLAEIDENIASSLNISQLKLV